MEKNMENETETRAMQEFVGLRVSARNGVRVKCVKRYA